MKESGSKSQGRANISLMLAVNQEKLLNYGPGEMERENKLNIFLCHYTLWPPLQPCQMKNCVPDVDICYEILKEKHKPKGRQQI